MKFVNDRIAAARAGMPLHGVQPIKDPSDEIVEVHLAALKWNILQRRFGLVASDLVQLQSSSAELLELLKSNLPDKTGEAAGWNFEKAHSILHKVREILLYGWSENFSTQAKFYISYVISDVISYMNWYVNSYRDRSIVTLTSARGWLSAPTTRMSFSVSCAGMCVQDTCSICAPWTLMLLMLKPKASRRGGMKLGQGSQRCQSVTI